MTRPGIEPRSPGPFANTLTPRSMSGIYIYIYIYIYNQNGLWRYRLTASQILNPSYHRNTYKEYRGKRIIRRFFQSIRFHTQKKDRANTTRLWYPQKNFYRSYDKKIMVHSPDGDMTSSVDVVVVLQGDTLLSYMLRLSFTNVKRANKMAYHYKSQEAVCDYRN